MPVSKRAYISAESDTTATISGPPSTLASLFSFSDTLNDTRKISLPINAAFHAPHLGDPDIDNVIGSILDGSEYHLRKDVVIISTSTGEQIPGHSLGEALEQIVWDILREPLRWSTVTNAISSRLSGQDAALISAGPVRAANSLRREMTNAGVRIVDSFEIQPLRTSQSRNTPGDIAIVGVAGRLPGGESLEEIWKNLGDGKDLHKRVSSRCRICDHLLTSNRYPKTGSMLTLTATRLERSKIRP